MNDHISIRTLTNDDHRAVERLAQLDSARTPTLPMLGAERGGELLAAISIDGTTVIANPWHPTAQLVDLLRLRIAQRSRSYASSRGAIVSPASLSSSQ